MRKLLVLTAAVFTLASCLNSTEYSESFPVCATFEYSNDYSQMFGADSLYFEAEYKVGFAWQNYLAFGHKINEQTAEFEGGFLLSYLAAPSSDDSSQLQNNLYRAGKKPADGKTYTVFQKTANMPQKHFWFNFNQGEIKGTCTPLCVMVNNTVAATDSIKANFQLGDSMTLKATGYLEGKKTDSAEIKLAEFTSAEDSIMSSWTLFDLSKLGQVDNIEFDFVIPEGRGVPETVCMDDFAATLSFSAQ